MYTEEEAKKKWCPFVRQLEEYAEQASYNRDHKGMPAGNCIASECMSWRWGGKYNEIDETTVYDRDLGRLTSADERVGYCGLAGKP